MKKLIALGASLLFSSHVLAQAMHDFKVEDFERALDQAQEAYVSSPTTENAKHYQTLSDYAQRYAAQVATQRDTQPLEAEISTYLYKHTASETIQPLTWEAMKSSCVDCSEIAKSITLTLHEQCGEPYNVATLHGVIQTSPIYGLTMAINSMEGEPDQLPMLLDAVKQSVDCDNGEQWVENLKHHIASVEYQTQKLSH